jgi:pyridoxal phosphate enzyme (YggS family)
LLTELRRNLEDVRERIRGAQQRGAHAAGHVDLVAVTKAAPSEALPLLGEAGVTDVGENRVQVALRHRRAAPPGLRWHGIGHLQRTKVPHAVEVFDVFHALDSLRLADRLEAVLQKREGTWPVYLEVNAAADPDKGGFAPEEALAALAHVAGLPHVHAAGFMTMTALGADEAARRATFRTLRQIRDEAVARGPGDAPPRGLSMGMSEDFELAVEEGATVVRVGTAIFGGLLDATPGPGQDAAREGRSG